MSTQRWRGRLLRKYVVVLLLLVGGILALSSLTELYFNFRETMDALNEIQREKAVTAATRIEQFVTEVERQLRGTLLTAFVDPIAARNQREEDYLRFLRNVPAITEIRHINSAGREEIRVSRVDLDSIDSQVDLSKEEFFTGPMSGKTFFSRVYFRNESEPYITIALADGGAHSPVTAGEVNLTRIWDVVSRIRIGKTGYAYAVDARGLLVAHPDISIVLQKRDLSGLPQVRSARAGAPDATAVAAIVRGLDGSRVITSHAAVAALGWLVFVEQPIGEVLAPLYWSLIRSGVLFLLGLLLSVAASVILARRMVAPIRTLQAGAARIGAGELSHRLEVKTGDELEALGDELNRTAAQLEDSYATLEHKVEARTAELAEANAELSESLEQQTAMADILKIINQASFDLERLLMVLLEKAARLCGAGHGTVYIFDGDVLRLIAHYNVPDDFLDLMRRTPLSPGLETLMGRIALQKRPVNVPDVLADPEYRFSEGQRTAGYRSLLGVPLLREGALLGTMSIWATDVRPFSERDLALVTSFADQAAIAIENVRLLTELHSRTAELTRSVEELKALGEVSQTVSSTLDLQTVLTTIVAHAVQLSKADGGTIYEFDEADQVFVPRANVGISAELIEALRDSRIRIGETAVGKAAAASFLKACAHDPKQRYASADEMHAELALLQSGKSVQRLRVIEQRLAHASRIGLIAASVALLSMGAVFVFGYRARVERESRQRIETALYDSYRANAIAERRSGLAGARSAALAAIAHAVAMRGPSAELRGEAIAALALADFRERRRIPISVLDAWRLAVSPDLAWFATTESDSSIHVARLTNGETVKVIPADVPPALVLGSFSEDAHWLSCHAPGEVRVWDWREGQARVRLASSVRRDLFRGIFRQGLLGWITPDNRFIWQQVPGGARHELKLPMHPTAFDAHLAAGVLVCGSSNLTGEEANQLWLVPLSGEPVTTLRLSSKPFFISWSPDGRRLLVGTTDFRLLLLDSLRPGAEHKVLVGHAGECSDAAWHPEGDLLVTAARDRTVRLWSTRDGHLLATHRANAQAGFLRCTRQEVGWFEAEAKEFVLCELTPRRVCQTLAESNPDPSAGPYQARFSPDGRLLATATRDGVRLYDAREGVELALLPAGRGLTVAFTPAGDALLHSTWDAVTRWSCGSEGGHWNIGPAQRVPLAEGRWFVDADGTFLSPGTARDIALSSNATDIVLLHNSQSLFPLTRLPARGWCLGTSATKAVLFNERRNESHLSLALSNTVGATFTPQGDLVMTVNRDGVRAWRTDSGRLTWQWLDRIEPVDTGFAPIACAPDGKLLVVALDTLRLVILDAATGELIARVSHPQPQPMVSLSFSPDGGNLAAACPSHVVQLWALHPLRSELAALGLDWNHPALPPLATNSPTRLTVAP